MKEYIAINFWWPNRKKIAENNKPFRRKYFSTYISCSWIPSTVLIKYRKAVRAHLLDKSSRKGNFYFPPTEDCVFHRVKKTQVSLPTRAASPTGATGKDSTQEQLHKPNPKSGIAVACAISEQHSTSFTCSAGLKFIHHQGLCSCLKDVQLRTRHWWLKLQVAEAWTNEPLQKGSSQPCFDNACVCVFVVFFGRGEECQSTEREQKYR